MVRGATDTEHLFAVFVDQLLRHGDERGHARSHPRPHSQRMIRSHCCCHHAINYQTDVSLHG